MTTTDHAAEIAAAEATLAAAQADVDRLRAQLTEQGAEQTGPRLATWEDGVAAARKRYPRRDQAGNGTTEGGAASLTGIAAGRAAALRRAALRGRGGSGSAA